MVTQDNLVADQLTNLVAKQFEVGIFIVFQFFADRVEFAGDSVEVFFPLGFLTQIFDGFLSFRLEIHLLVLHESDEKTVFPVRQFERIRIHAFAVPFVVIVREILDISFAVKRHRETAGIDRVETDVRHYAAPVVHFPPGGGLVLPNQRIRHQPHAAVVVAVRIIDRLDTTAAGNVIFRGSHFQESVVPQRTRSLHQSFAERPLSDQHGTVEILQRSRHDLGGRGRHTVHQHGDRNLRIERFGLRHERRVG